MRKFSGLSLFVLVSLLLSLMPVSAQDGGAPATAASHWYIVEFNAPSLVAYAKSSERVFRTMSSNGKLDAHTSASQAYIATLETQQAKFKTTLAQALPGAEVAYTYQVALNAVAVHLPNSDAQALAALRKLPNVARITPQRIYTEQMDYSLEIIQAAALWSQQGGRANAGAGLKVAIIDSGIDAAHPLFAGTGWSYPTEGTWPKGYCADVAGFCNGKIIAAHWYSPTIDIHPTELFTPQDVRGHGTHVGGTAAGNIVTATYGTATPQISGVAPGAWIMSYKGLFLNPAGTQSSGDNIMLAAAVEDAIQDMPDIINCSWGGDQWELDDPLKAAYEAAVDAGIVVVFSTGNSGSGYNTAGDPSSYKFIEVGASTTPRAFYNEVKVTAPAPVSATLQSFAGNQFNDIDASAIPTETIGPLPYLPCDLTGAPDMTLPGVTPGITETAPYASGWIALIPRGQFDFSTKLGNALAHGAVAAVMYTDNRTWKGGFTAGDRPIYTVMIANELGLAARNWWTLHPGEAELEIGYPVSPFESETPDVIADFSSRGPNLRLEIQPDLVAPGVNILSGLPGGGYIPRGGTSMAAPHVAGAAALLLMEHPTWTPMQVKSALMSTASQTVLDLDETTVADIMTQGAGRIDLSQASDPGLTFNKPSHSFGMLPAGGTAQVVIAATDVASATETYALSVQELVTATGATVSVSPASLPVAANGSAVFTLTVSLTAGASLQDIEGNVILSGTTHLAHIPYWARIAPAATGDVLLVDDDMSGIIAWGLSDYQGYYTRTLDALGMTYDVWDTTGAGFPGIPARAVLDTYDAVLYFTGDGPTSFVAGLGAGQDDVRAYLAAGGKMLVFGQDAAWALNNAGLPISVLFGADYGVDDVFGGYAIPRPSATGLMPFLDGKVVDFASGGDGAGNMATVDGLSFTAFGDTDNIPLFGLHGTMTPLPGGRFMGSAISSDPTLERLADPVGSGWFKLAYRTTFCSFGLEAVNDNTGYTTRAELLGDMFDYVNDQLTVAFNASAYTGAVAETITFSATMASSVGGEALEYRWDFGDSDNYIVTADSVITHTYTAPGVYQARVEVADTYMHTAVGAPVAVTVAGHIFLPLVLRSYPAP